MMVVKIFFCVLASNPKYFLMVVGSSLILNYHFLHGNYGSILESLDWNIAMPAGSMRFAAFTLLALATPLNAFQRFSAAISFCWSFRSTGCGGGVTCSTGAGRRQVAATTFLLAFTSFPKARNATRIITKGTIERELCKFFASFFRGFKLNFWIFFFRTGISSKSNDNSYLLKNKSSSNKKSPIVN